MLKLREQESLKKLKEHLEKKGAFEKEVEAEKFRQ